MLLDDFTTGTFDVNFSPKNVISFVEENDVKFIRLTFCNMFGELKNIAIMPRELPRAFESGIPFNGAVLTGKHCDLYLVPEVSTLSVLPWRPKTGRVVRFFCYIKNPDGTDFDGDVRYSLRTEIERIKSMGYSCNVGTECEFYLFDTDENGEPTKIPHDKASYLDVAPLDKCENVRREICLTLDEMGLKPLSSRHKYGCGQNEIDFSPSDLLTAADNTVHFKSAVKTISAQNGLYASFMPKPLPDKYGSGLHINISVKKGGENIFFTPDKKLSTDAQYFIAGIISKIKEITCFLNPTTNSYKRFGMGLAPKSINWSFENRDNMIRVESTSKESARVEIRCADASCNPHIAFKLLVRAGFDGIKNKTQLNPDCFDSLENSGKAPMLTKSLDEAYNDALNSDFVNNTLSENIKNAHCDYLADLIEKYNNADDKNTFEDEFYFRSI